MSKYENIKVAVAMATYNTDPEMLSQSIESILSQTHKNLVFYIVNDSGENLSQLKKIADDRVIIIEHEEKIGLAQSMNEILDISKEKYIFRMDSDDISLPDRLEREIEYMENHKDIDVASMFCKKIGSASGFVFSMGVKPDDVKTSLLFTNVISHPCAVFRNEFFQKNNIRYNALFLAAQDYDLWNRCAELTKLAIIPRVGLFYRVHKNQISAARREIQSKFGNEAIKSKLRKLGLEDGYYKYLKMLPGYFPIDDFPSFSKAMVDVVNANKKVGLYNHKSLINKMSYYYLVDSLKTHNLIKAIMYSKITRKMVFNPNNLLTLIKKIKILCQLNLQMKLSGL